MSTLVQVLRDNPILLLFVVAGIGYPLGRIRIGGASLGVAAVLFVGLAIGGLDPDLKLPEVVYSLGLVLFVYAIGLSSGSMFFSSLRHRGLRYNLLVGVVLLLAALLAGLAHALFGLDGPTTAGLFAGSLTNTPALASVVENIKSSAPPGLVEQLQAEPVIAYSIAYPFGVLGMILSIYVAQRLWKVDYAVENRQVEDSTTLNEPIHNQTLRVTAAGLPPVAALMSARRWNVIFGRLRHGSDTSLVTGQTVLQPGDLVNVIGPQEAIQDAAAGLGESVAEHLEFDLSQFDKRRFWISNSDVAGRQIKDLDLYNHFTATITRMRRGDVEFIPHGETVMGLGDQVRVVAPHGQMESIRAFFGDSYRAVSEIDVLSFSLGLGIGLLLGMVPIPLPGGVVLHLGIAGGPLLVSLVLGALGRTGSLVWQIPYSANLTLRQVGLILFLAGIGTRSGYAFFNTLANGGGQEIFLAGAVITFLASLAALWIGYRRLHVPMGILVGILAGMQTQPAVLGFGLEQTRSELPNVGYASVYPLAMILKILLAQALLLLLK
ncbi:MAG: aspartate:alanine exchanger family transporter [Anaerolineaceae bacterium]|nr:aspartate:alanine exchanger family transporter [Anaerolineaceae bacterium]